MKRISCKSGDTVGEASKAICEMIERAYPDNESGVSYFINDYFDRKYKTGIHEED
tara:strand:+ start:1266 stop:1430 length:165 start_codon:yes stop_codon:yes gene_type:complete